MGYAPGLRGSVRVLKASGIQLILAFILLNMAGTLSFIQLFAVASMWIAGCLSAPVTIHRRGNAFSVLSIPSNLYSTLPFYHSWGAVLVLYSHIRRPLKSVKVSSNIMLRQHIVQ